MYRGMFNVPGHGTINVYDYESEVPTSLMGSKVGIVEATASQDLRYGGMSTIMSPNPGPMGVYAFVAILVTVIGVVFIVYMLTATSVTETDYGYYVQYPGGVSWVDLYGNVISSQGAPLIPAIGDIVTPIVITALVLGGLFITGAYILPAFRRSRGRPTYPAATSPPI